MEETHYYPFGLTMAGISSKALVFGGVENRYKYNDGTELNTDFGLSWYETMNRSYDPQIGRFLQIDEFGEVAEEWSPYVYAYNNPLIYNDPLGLFSGDPEPDKPTGKLAEEKTLQNVTVVGVKGGLWAKTRFYYRLMDYTGGDLNKIVNDRLRADMQNIDGIVKFRERINEMTREQDKITLEVASWFIPTGALFKILKFKKVLALFKLKRGSKIVQEATEQTISHLDEAAKALKNISPYELEATHGLTSSKKALQALKADIQANGIQEPIKFVEHNGKKYVVDGHHRLRVAKELGMQNVPVEQVKLPYAGYKTVDDLIYSRY